MSVYIIVDITVEDLDQYQQYVQLVPPIIARHQGKYLVRGGESEVQEGDWQPGRLVVLEFPSKANVTAFLNDPDYQPIAAIRHASASSNMVIVEGYE